MAKKTKTGAKREKPRERRERQFEPAASTNKWIVYAVGGVGSTLMGAGAWAQFAPTQEGGPGPLKFGPYVLAAGAALVGVAIWIGTSGEPALRVGDGGLAMVKGGVKRIPWYAIERIEWRDEAVKVSGKDDLGTSVSLVASLRSQPQAAAWIVKEARERIPSVVDVPEDATLPAPLASAGAVMQLEPPQVVGRHCAASGKVIAYEPDARVCMRCERVYHKAQVPTTCECGASLAELQQAAKTG
jgi:hypothetical protein